MKKVNKTFKLSEEALMQVLDILQFGILKQQDVTEHFKNLQFIVKDDELVPTEKLSLYNLSDYEMTGN